MDLQREIIKCIENNGMNKPALMINGQYLTCSGRRVYVTPAQKQSDELVFFTRVYNKDIRASEVEDIGSQIKYINAQVRNNRLFDMELSLNHEYVDTKVYADPSFNIVFVESALYEAGKVLQEDTSPNLTFLLGNQRTNTEETRAVRTVFLQKSLENYRNFVYATGTNRFIRSLFRANRLYSLTPISFLPVFIDYKNVYNPLNSKSLGVKDTKMYKIAVEKGRFVQNGDVSAYFLTHREICEAFGMTRFARFTPYIWYNLFVGLLQPSNAAFPNKITKVVKWTSDTQPPEGLKKSYSETDFAKMLGERNDLLPEELNQYKLVDSLEDFITREHSMIKSVGPFYIDEKINLTPANLYSLYSEAKLQF